MSDVVPLGRVLLLVESVLYREGLLSRLGAVSDVVVSGEQVRLVTVCRESRPDVVLLDAVKIIELSELVQLRRNGQLPGATIVALVMTGSAATDQLADLVRVGVDGILTVVDDIGSSIAAIRDRRTKSSWISPVLGGLLLAGIPTCERSLHDRAAHGQPGTRPSITATEHRVLQWVADGWTDLDIAATMDRSARAVKYHVSNLLAKYGARNRAHLVKLAIGAGVLRPDTCPKGQDSTCPIDTGQRTLAQL